MSINKLLILFITLSLLACKEKGEHSEKTAQNQNKAVSETKKYKLTPFANSPSYSDAIIQSFDYQDGKMRFKLPGKDYQLGMQTADATSKMCANSAKGQHIHVILDNAPYSAKYSSEFDYDIPDGEHYLLAFLSRSYHESIKDPKASIAKKIYVKDKSIQDSKNLPIPMVFYSRPKGTYVGDDTKKVMLDFYLVNAELEKWYQLQANINGEIHDIPKWQPYYIEGLPMGENTIELTLFNADGSKVRSPLNPVKRTFTLKAMPEG